MPGSLRRHNLVRLRDELNLTQANLGLWVGRSAATIKSIETGRLALSPRLAELIAAVTGADAGWLLRNDLNERMPPLKRISAKLDPKQEAYVCTCILLSHLFERLFVALARLMKTQERTMVETEIEMMLNNLKKIDQEPAGEPARVVSVDVFEFFKTHPELLDPDLASLINLDFLIKDTYRVNEQIKAYNRQLSPKINAREAVLSPKERGQWEQSKHQHRKSPRRNQASPSRAGQHKKPKLS